MAELQPFAGLRYDTQHHDLSALIAPPYDVVKGDMRDRLVARSPHNVIEIELPEGDGDEKYDNAAKLLRQWAGDGVLHQDGVAFYVYEQEFTVPGTEVRKKRRGVLGALRLEEFGEGVQPHEHTLSGPKEDRLKLLRATRTNISPIFGLFDDTSGWVDSLLNVACGNKPLATAVDGEGVTHRLCCVDDDEAVNAIVAALEDQPLLIADGHHRYETALNYRNERRAKAPDEWTDAEPENFVLMMCVSTTDDGLVVLPTHRLIKGVSGEELSRLEGSLQNHFEIQPVIASNDAAGNAACLLERLNAAGSEARIGMHVKGRSAIMQLRAGNDHLEAMDAARSNAYNELEVTLLHRLILERELGIDGAALAAGGRVGYTIDAAEAISAVERGDYDAAFFLRPTPVTQVQAVAAAGDKMPQKSTYFYPKLATGLVLRPLDHN